MTFSRNSPWMILVNTLENVPTYVPLLVAYSLSQPRLNGPLSIAVTVFFSCYSCVTAYSIFAHWVARFFSFDDEGIRHRQGLFSKTDTFLPWSSVAAIEVHSDPVRGIAGCCKVVVRASVGSDREITLDVVRCELIDEIRRVSGLPVSQARERPDGSGSSRDGWTSREPIFVASHGDLVVMSLAYGRFALFVPFAVGTYMELAEMVGLPDPEWIVVRSLSGNLATQVAWLVGIALIAIAYGYAVTLLRFWRLRVSIADGSLHLEGGLLTSQQRTIPLSGVIGLVLRRNIFELLTGRGRLALLTRDANQILGKNVVLPALKMSEIETRVDAINKDARELLALDRASMRAGRVWWIASARVAMTVSAFVLVLVASGLWRYYAAAAAVVIPLCLVMVNACFTLLVPNESGERILYRRGVMWRSSYSLPLTEVQVFRSDSRPWDRWMGLRRRSLYYFSGGTRKLFAWQPATSHSVGLGDVDGG